MIYIHIPYCRSFCTYCGFYSEIKDAGFGAFTDALCREISDKAGEIPWENNTLYIGGGTPSVLPLCDLRRITAAVRSVAPVRDFEEFTIEVNPDDIVRGGARYVEGLLGLGVNRVSMGVQSLDDRVLRWMNRRHDAATARKAYRLLRSCGVRNISIDLIFGYGSFATAGRGFSTAASCRSASISASKSGNASALGCASAAPLSPGFDGRALAGAIGQVSPRRAPATASAVALSAEELFGLWERTIEEALDIGGDGRPPEHISAYQLSVEPGSTLCEMVSAGGYAEAPDELCALEYETLCRLLSSAGYHHYEISNFALPGEEARHNSAYWSHVPYIGFGPAAHSFLCKGSSEYIRRWNKPDINAYLAAAGVRGSGVAAGNRVSERPSERNAARVNPASAAGSYPVKGQDNAAEGVGERGSAARNWDAVSGSESLSEGQLRTEKIMLGLRTDKGIDRQLIPSETAHRLEDLQKNGSLVIEGAIVRIPENHFFVSDDIISELI